MKQKKIICLIASLCCVASAAAYEFEVVTADGLSLGVNVLNASERTCVVGGLSSSSYSGTLVIPSEVDYNGVTYTVTQIGSFAFEETKISAVVIPGTVTSIGKSAFEWCSNLQSVDMGNGVVSIGDSAFYGCQNLTTLSVSTSLQTLEAFAFGSINAAEISLPEGLTTIGKNAFCYNYALEALVIPSTVTSIGDATFVNCRNLKSLTMMNPDPSTIAGTRWIVLDAPLSTCTLYVPAGSKALYEQSDIWGRFNTIREFGGVCATPVISINDEGNLVVECDTEGALLHTRIKGEDNRTVEHAWDEPIALCGQYYITSYATLDGYDDSDVATAVLMLANLEEAPEGVDVIGTSDTRAMLLCNDGTHIVVKGTGQGEPVKLLDADGTEVFTGAATEGVYVIPVDLTPGTEYIVQVGGTIVRYTL